MELFGWKYRVKILKKTDQGYVKVKQKTIKPTQETLEYKNRTYTWSLAEASHREGRCFLIHKDFDTGETVLQWGTTGAALPPDGIKQKNKERLIQKAVSVNPNEFGLITLIVAAVGALCAGMVIMAVAYPSIFPQMMKPVEMAVKTVAGVI